MIKPVREAAGMGCPPTEFTQCFRKWARSSEELSPKA